MLIGKGEIARLIPHAGSMCLLDGVLHVEQDSIQCRSTSHHALGNPLRYAGRLGILCGVEYAAQAMALHAALTDPAPKLPRAGYLASLRTVICHTDRLDLFPGPLLVDATRLLGDAGRAIYGFALRHDARVLIEGRAAVALRV